METLLQGRSPFDPLLEHEVLVRSLPGRVARVAYAHGCTVAPVLTTKRQTVRAALLDVEGLRCTIRVARAFICTSSTCKYGAVKATPSTLDGIAFVIVAVALPGYMEKLLVVPAEVFRAIGPRHWYIEPEYTFVSRRKQPDPWAYKNAWHLLKEAARAKAEMKT